MKQIKKLFPLAALALLAGACVVNMEDGEPSPVAGEEGRVVTLALAVPGLPASRAGLDDTGENVVETVDVLLFKDDKFYYRAIGSNINDDGGITKKKFNVRLPMGTYGIVVLANARAALAGITPATIDPAGDPRATVLDALEQVVQPFGGPNKKWTEMFNRIPMWGYYKDGASTTLTINEGVTTLQPINLTRAIARVDVSVKDVPPPDPSPRDKFSLESVYLYNYSRAGSLAPKVFDGSGTDVDGYDGNQWKNLTIPAPAGIKAAAPHLPSHTDLKVKGPLEYVIDDDPAAPHAYVYKQEIYTYEAAAGTPGTVTNTCLVIGGYYDGNEDPTYYRVDFVDGAKEPLPLLRNYKYNVEIQEVNGHGYPTPGDAYANEPANIVVNIVPWDEGGMNDVDFNGQHYLAVDKSELVFYTSGADKILEAITDYPGGWTVTTGVPDFPDWLQVIKPDPEGNVSTGVVDKQTTLKLTADPLGSGTREGFFYIVAGNLKKKITVRQLNEDEFSLGVSPWELTFYKTVTSAKTVILSPVPAASPAYTLGATGNVKWKDNNDPAEPADKANILAGNVLSLWPKTNAESYTLGSTVLVTLVGPDGKSVTKVVNVKQLARDPLFKVVVSNPYPAMGGDYTFTLASEVSWKLGYSDTPLGILTLTDFSKHEANPNAPYPYTFSLAQYATSDYTATRSEEIKVTSNDPDFLPATITIEQSAAPYLVITNPTSKEHDFGTTPTSREVTFKTNAGWFFNGDASFGDVIAGVTLGGTSIAAGLPAQTGSTLPYEEVEETLTFTPRPSLATETAGMKSTGVTFTTANHGAAPEASDVMTFYRLVPARWEFVSSNPAAGSEIIARETTVTLVANTNLQWWGQATDNTAGDVGEKKESAIPAAYTEDDPITVTVPERPTDNAASWASTGTTTIQAGYDASPGIPALAPLHEFTLDRPAYTLNVEANYDVPSISVKLTVSTTAPRFSLTLRAGSSDGSPVGWLEQSGEGDFTATIYPNEGTEDRVIHVTNTYGPEGNTLANFLQPPISTLWIYGPVAYTYSWEWTYRDYCPTGYTQQKEWGNPVGLRIRVWPPGWGYIGHVAERLTGATGSGNGVIQFQNMLFQGWICSSYTYTGEWLPYASFNILCLANTP
jgi:hypothetical protein